MKKYLAIAVAALLLVCSLASCASGSDGSIEDYTPEVDYLVQKDKDGNITGTFYFDEGDGETAILRKYVGKKTSDDHVVVPDKFGDRVVTSIGKEAFYNLAAIVEVTLPDTLLEIDDYAFARCTELTSITLPDSVVSIGEGAFIECTALVDVKMSTSLEEIGDKAFYGCTAMTDFDLSVGLITIGNGSFTFCKGLTNLVIPASVNSVGELAYTDCTGLESITFISDATEIGAHAFEHGDGTNLKSKFVTTGLGAESKVMTYVNGLSDSVETDEVETDPVDAE